MMFFALKNLSGLVEMAQEDALTIVEDFLGKVEASSCEQLQVHVKSAKELLLFGRDSLISDAAALPDALEITNEVKSIYGQATKEIDTAIQTKCGQTPGTEPKRIWPYALGGSLFVLLLLGMCRRNR